MSYVLNLPNHILEKIFLQLPIGTLVGCRYVCKSWRQVLSDMNFLKHGGFSNLMLCVDKGRHSRSSPPRSIDFYFLYRSKEGSENFDEKNLAVAFEWSSELSDIWVENSCQGLLCGCSKLNRWPGMFGIWILNPLTGEYIILPDQKPKDFYQCALGFCPNTNQYKVVRMFYTRDETIEAEVHTIGSTDWSKIDWRIYIYFHHCRWESFTNVHVNGSIHWLIKDDDQPIQICAFNFETEKFRLFSLPPGFRNSKSIIDVGLHEDSIYFCSYSYTSKPKSVEVWLMKEYGIKGSWTKLLVMDFNNRCSYIGRLLHFLEYGNLLLEDGKNITLFVHNHEWMSCLKKAKSSPKFVSSVFVNKPSFASLEDVVGESSSVLKGFVWDHQKP